MPTSIHDLLGELYVSSTDERDKGDKFERLMAAFLRTDVTFIALPELLQRDVPLPQQLLQPSPRRLLLTHPYPLRRSVHSRCH